MKKSLLVLFSALLISSFCFAAEAPVTVPADKDKDKVVVVAAQKKDADKKPVKQNIKKSNKKIRKTNRSAKK